ncbi:MAG: hypothetical protein R3B94_06020 [Hyphomonas sp.]
MGKEYVIWRLAVLASYDYQSRYIIGGTQEKYLLTSEVLEDAFDIDRILHLTPMRGHFSPQQLEALRDLHSCLMQNYDAALAGDTREKHLNNIRDGAPWTLLRQKAATALSCLGVDAHRLTVDDIDRLLE